jgi:hypothetical protein
MFEVPFTGEVEINERVKKLISYITELVLRKLYTILSNPIYIRYRLYSCFFLIKFLHTGETHQDSSKMI